MQSCWKESRGEADWVIVTDIDEHLHHPDLPGYLALCRNAGTTFIPALGYQMVASEFPSPDQWLCKTVTMGAPWVQMSKVNIFDPNAIEEINDLTGRHMARPTGRAVAPDRDELLLLHYKYLGFECSFRRHQQCATRLGLLDVANQLAHKWRFSREQLMEDWQKFATRLVDVSRPDLEPWRSHQESRWWEEYRRKHLVATSSLTD